MNKITADANIIRILWTGGWDSTFQLLRVLLIDKKQVIPYYLKDENRSSTYKEIQTMEKIRSKIYEIDNHMVSLLLPTKILAVSEIPEFMDITNAYKEIKKERFIGSQYDWLARFCEYMNISNLQLCIHKDDKFEAVLHEIIGNDTQRKGYFEGSDLSSSTYEHTVFRYFTFPILKLTKIEMENIARKNRWMDIMVETWFCHNPKDGKPCGRCNPCLYTVEEGLGWRIPWRRLLTGQIYRFVIRPVKTVTKRTMIKFR